MNDLSASNTQRMKVDRPPVLLTVPEACDALRISRWSLYQLINKGRLKSIRIDRRRLIVEADLVALIDELRAEGGGDGR